MGCLLFTNSPENKDDDKQSDPDHIDYTETYDPANMSVSRESTMADYQFTGKRTKGSFKTQSSLKRAIKLSTIMDTENDNEIATETNAQDMIKMMPLPRKRVIFISIAQLNACIDDIPSYILSESIFCFKAERSWFFPSNHIERRDSRHSIRHKITFNDTFLNVLKEKEENNLILWLEQTKTWQDISDELIMIQDIYYTQTEVKTYNALKLDSSWWINHFEKDKNTERSKYCDSADVVIEELITSKLKFNPTMELLYESNHTLIPMRGFDFEIYLNHHYVAHIVPVLTPYIAPYNQYNIININNMESIDITDCHSNSNPSIKHQNISNSNDSNPNPSIKQQNISNEHDMVFIASDDEIFGETQTDHEIETKHENNAKNNISK